MSFYSTIPLFPVKDITATVDYYETTLGFKVANIQGDPPIFASLERDNINIHFAVQVQPYAPPLHQKVLLIVVDDVDTLFHELKTSEVDIIKPIGNRDYGYRDFDIIDINGFIVSFGTALK